MIVDDDQSDRELLIRYLKKFFEQLVIPGKVMPRIIETKNASHAWDILTQSKIIPDLMIIDLEMPGMNGDYLIEKIKKELQLNSELVLHSGHYLADQKAKRLNCRSISKVDGQKGVFSLAVELGLFTP